MSPKRDPWVAVYLGIKNMEGTYPGTFVFADIWLTSWRLVLILLKSTFPAKPKDMATCAWDAQVDDIRALAWLFGENSILPLWDWKTGDIC